MLASVKSLRRGVTGPCDYQADTPDPLLCNQVVRVTWCFKPQSEWYYFINKYMMTKVL